VDPTVFEKISNALAFAVVDEEDCIEQLIARFSCLRKLKVAVAWLRRFIVFLCRRRMPNLELKKEPISVEELTAAETAIVRYVQRQNFGRWVIESTGGGQLLRLRNESSPVMKLHPILVDNVLSVCGRLDKAPLSYEARHLAILPHVSHLTELVIRHFHERVAHFGVNHTLNAICQRYWITKAAVAIRRMISKCVSCGRNSQPGRQLMAELPPARLQIDTPAFSHVGIDYFSPLMIRQRQATVKRYGCIYTCMTTRAVCLDIAADLSTDALINTIRRCFPVWKHDSPVL